jgi:hypothetical protein
VVGMGSVRRILHEASALDSAEWTAALREA